MSENNCYVCGAKLSAWGAPGANKCKLCDHNVCDRHYRDGICSYCKEKMGKK